MLKSCNACNRIHDSKYICPQRQRTINDRQRKFKENREIDKFRNSGAWKRKREEIKDRDLHLCQVCIRKLCDTLNQYTYSDLSIHHAISLVSDYDKRLDNDNLITVCGYHHEMAEKGTIPTSEVLKIIQEQENKVC